jgi:hypothetical protein
MKEQLIFLGEVLPLGPRNKIKDLTSLHSLGNGSSCLQVNDMRGLGSVGTSEPSIANTIVGYQFSWQVDRSHPVDYSIYLNILIIPSKAGAVTPIDTFWG